VGFSLFLRVSDKLEQMPRKEKIHLEKVLAALNTLCPACGYSITPAEIRRVDFDKMKCPRCGEVFAVKLRQPEVKSLREKE
jgi:ribosomal protein S27AE